MKYSIAILALAAGVFAQESASITSAPSSKPSLTPQVSCILDCSPGDVTCQAACQGIARPNSSQAAETNECAAKCDQGSGSPEDTQKYAKCQADCFASLFPSTQTDFPGAGGAASQASGAASSAVSSAASAASSGASAVKSSASSALSSATGDASNTQSGAAGESTNQPGSANANSVKIAGAGLAGLMAFFL